MSRRIQKTQNLRKVSKKILNARTLLLEEASQWFGLAKRMESM
jgi:hypothetical protein